MTVIVGATGHEGDYLTPEERERRARQKEQQLIERGLTPDWFRRQRDFCLPPSGLNVAVIGGGFAGLAAGWYLKSCGVTTALYEASGRLGGRVQTDRTFAHPKVVEAGAELIGENHPLWRILARGFGLSLVPISDEKSYPPNLQVRTRFGGKDLSEQDKERLERELRAPLAAIGQEARAISETAPWETPEAARLDAMSIEDKLNVLIGRASSLARKWFEFTLGNDNCASISAQSYLGLLASVSAARMGSDAPGMLGYWLSTETHRCKDGNDLLSAQLGRFLQSNTRIGTSADGVLIQPGCFPPVVVKSTQRNASGVAVRPRFDGFHYAVLAVPPSVWGSIPVTPTFPPASRSLQHGSAIKFLSRYPTDFWQKASLAPLAKWDELGSVWEGTDKQTGAPVFALSVFSGGPFVQPQASYPERLTQIYPTRTRSPGSEKFVDWPSTPFIQTGYAVPAVGQASTIFPAQIQPHLGRLYFAGEQTSPGFFGYMEGALQSGARAARDIVRAAAVPCPRVASSGSTFTGGGGGESGGGGSSDSF